MLFNTLSFVVFFVLVLVLYYLPALSWRARKAILLIASYLFYAAWNPPFVALLWLSTITDWIAAKRIHHASQIKTRRAFLLLSIFVNLGLLSVFKYGGFLVENLCLIFEMVGVHYRPAQPNIILPIGISFYTFQTLSYSIDVYRKQQTPSSSFLDYALFVTFFPQLVAGPIVRAKSFLPQCIQPKTITRAAFSWSVFLITLGLFQKAVLADQVLAPVVDYTYAKADALMTSGTAWVGQLAFAGQIFFDFSGYSTIAIGCAGCLGFRLPENFHSPCAAAGFVDFWRRWHITLSSWFRDYLYGPLGNLLGKARASINLIFVMLLIGLWHGASWTFVVWGTINGFLMVIEGALKPLYSKWAWSQRWGGQLLGVAVTFAINCVIVSFFRAPNFTAAANIILSLFGAGPESRGWPLLTIAKVLPVMIVLLVMHWQMRKTGLRSYIQRRSRVFLIAVWVFMLVALALVRGESDAFIYFQF